MRVRLIEAAPRACAVEFDCGDMQSIFVHFDLRMLKAAHFNASRRRKNFPFFKFPLNLRLCFLDCRRPEAGTKVGSHGSPRHGGFQKAALFNEIFRRAEAFERQPPLLASALPFFIASAVFDP